MSTQFRRWRIPIAATVVVFATAGPVTRTVLHAAGASSTSEPYTALAATYPGAASLGVVPGRALYVNVENHTGSRRPYTWRLSDTAGELAHGSVVVGNGGRADIEIPTDHAERSTRLFVSLDGLPQQLILPVKSSS